ncbi:MAG: amidohydrolase family protein, partial [Proteobacteria bacterium]|nr:amidohydrolase family protein [Pseudomonadota bacterium]
GSGSTAFSGLGALLRMGSKSMTVERPRAALYARVGGKDTGSRAETWMALRRWLDLARLSERERRRLTQTESLDTKRDIDVIEKVVRGELPLVVETHRESDIRQAIALAGEYGLRLILQGGSEAWAVADLLAARNIPVILDPTSNLPLYFDRARVRDDSAAILDEAGVVIALFADGIHQTFNAGYALRELAGIAVANGLEHPAAVRALTENPAGIWGLQDDYGTIAAGRNADLIVWDGDPFEPATSITHVFLEGRPVPMDTRRTRLRDRYAPKVPQRPAPQ